MQAVVQQLILLQADVAKYIFDMQNRVLSKLEKCVFVYSNFKNWQYTKKISGLQKRILPNLVEIEASFFVQKQFFFLWGDFYGRWSKLRLLRDFFKIWFAFMNAVVLSLNIYSS